MRCPLSVSYNTAARLYWSLAAPISGRAIGDRELGLLGRDVRGRAEELTGRREIDHRRVDEFAACDTEVSDLERSARVEHEVLGLHVAVQDAVLVHVLEPGSRRECGRDRSLDAHTGEAAVGEGSAREILHDEQSKLAILAVVVHGDDVRMAEPRQDARLSPEPRRVLGSVGTDELLDRDVVFELAVTRAPHDPPLAPAELAPNLIVGERARNLVPTRAHSRHPDPVRRRR